MKSSVQNKEIKELTTAELDEKIKAATLEYNKMKINHAITPLESPIQIRDKRKYIARLLTEKRSREINNAQ
jgi:large subunit ribosomal protein L29